MSVLEEFYEAFFCRLTWVVIRYKCYAKETPKANNLQEDDLTRQSLKRTTEE